jgi:hypothetical protein
MVDLVHRIKIFVYRFHGSAPDYLLLRGQGPESFWGPIQGPIGFGEKLETAIKREVMDDIGVARPMDLLDLQMPSRWLVGDEEIIEWTFGFRTRPEQPKLKLSQRWAGHRWAAFGEAYPSLELDVDRAAILRLHALLNAA